MLCPQAPLLRGPQGSQLAHAIRRSSSVAAKNGPCVVNVLARGRHQWAIILPQGYQFSFCRQEPQERSIHQKAARGTAARHRSLLPAHTGRQPYQRAHCHRLHRLRRSEVAHSSAGARIPAHTGCVASRGVRRPEGCEGVRRAWGWAASTGNSNGGRVGRYKWHAVQMLLNGISKAL